MVDRPNRGAALDWRKSSASEEQDCVEVAVTGGSVLVRDSRAPAAGMLELAPAQWWRLLRHIVDDDEEAR
ncbi:DUF397 domain-containing protein [Actinomadura sp. 21ATH]|uniref:DUF397 domain-containing protein n=1 Tax=Actinomadura sp. 21ATH TaxID=1735444 RepID=UPI0035BEFD78